MKSRSSRARKRSHHNLLNKNRLPSSSATFANRRGSFEPGFRPRLLAKVALEAPLRHAPSVPGC